MKRLLTEHPAVVNVGLRSFAETIAGRGGSVAHVDWKPPEQGDAALARALARLTLHPQVEAANQRAFDAFAAARPVLEGVGVARELVPGMEDRMLLHAGPPIAWDRMGGTMRGAVVGAILLEGWAGDAVSAQRLAESGRVRFDPCHHHDAVGPMAGIVSPSMPVWIVRNATHGNFAFATLNEGLGKVLRFGANGREVLERLKWMARVLAPALSRALKHSGPVELKPLMARALHMGDELHNRNIAATSLLLRQLAPALLRAGVSAPDVAAVLEFINGNDHFFLNIGMAACKAMLRPAAGVPHSSMVVTMARNGTDFGIQMSATADRWFTAPALVADGLFFSGYSRADAAADIGDSAITETAGLGGFAMAAAPAIVQFVGGTPDQALANTRSMMHITIGRNAAFTLPPLNFDGTPSAIDARKVVDTGLRPVINTGIAHREPGIGQIGAGITYAPLACFAEAVRALACGVADGA